MDFDELEVEVEEGDDFATSREKCHQIASSSAAAFNDPSHVMSRAPLTAVSNGNVGFGTLAPRHHQSQQPLQSAAVPPYHTQKPPVAVPCRHDQTLWQQVLECEGVGTQELSGGGGSELPRGHEAAPVANEAPRGDFRGIENAASPPLPQVGVSLMSDDAEPGERHHHEQWGPGGGGAPSSIPPGGEGGDRDLIMEQQDTPYDAEEEETTGLRRVLPGPAGRLQQAAAAGRVVTSLGDVLDTPSGNGGADMHGGPRGSSLNSDPDFRSKAWVTALEALDLGGSNSEGGLQTLFQHHGAAAIRRSETATRVPQMLAMVVSLKPSGCGDAFVKLKDPSGTVSGSIHQTVIEAEPDISPGAVLVLRQVPVVVPAPRLHYLCITAKQLVQVLPADTGASDGPRDSAPLLLQAPPPPPQQQLQQKQQRQHQQHQEHDLQEQQHSDILQEDHHHHEQQQQHYYHQQQQDHHQQQRRLPQQQQQELQSDDACQEDEHQQQQQQQRQREHNQHQQLEHHQQEPHHRHHHHHQQQQQQQQQAPAGQQQEPDTWRSATGGGSRTALHQLPPGAPTDGEAQRHVHAAGDGQIVGGRGDEELLTRIRGGAALLPGAAATALDPDGGRGEAAPSLPQVQEDGDEDMAELMDMLSDDGDEDMLTGGPSSSGGMGRLSAAAAAAAAGAPRQPLLTGPCITTQHREVQGGAGGCGVHRHPAVKQLPLQGNSNHCAAANGVESRGAGPAEAVQGARDVLVSSESQGSGSRAQQTQPPSPPVSLMASREGGGVSHAQRHDDDESDYGGGSSEDEGAPGWEL